MHLWKHLDWVVKLIPCSFATIHTHIWKLALQQRLQICDILMIYRRIYYFDRHLQIYIYLYRALLKYANFAKSCQAKGKSWVMQGQVEKRKDEFWSPVAKTSESAHKSTWQNEPYFLMDRPCDLIHIFVWSQDMITFVYDHMRLCNDGNHWGYDHILTIS